MARFGSNFLCRPRLQFSLATLLIAVTVLCVWLGGHAQAVHRRSAMRIWIEERGGLVDYYEIDELKQSGDAKPDWYTSKLAKYPAFRAWFGDKAIYYINLVHADFTWAEREEVARTFPEAWVVPEKPSALRSKRAH
jgi:hypothetical protein